MISSIDESELYQIAKQELDNKTYDESLWRKAMVLMGGNEEEASKKYIKLRINQLMKDDYLANQTENSKSENKKSQPNEENDYKKDYKSESKNVDGNTEETNSNNKTENENKSDRINVLDLALWIFLIMIVASIIWYSNTESDKKEPNSTMISTKYNGVVKIIKETELRVQDYIVDSNLMHSLEVEAKEVREAKKREKIKEKEAADIEYIKAVQEVNEEE